MTSMRAVVAVMVLVLACAAGAQAHGEGPHTGFASRVSVIEPFLPGLLVQVVGGHEQLSIANLTDKNVVILDARSQPYVRIPAGTTEVWIEPRVGAADEPPEREGLVRNWRIPGTVDGEPFEIRGFLGYRPPTGASQDDDSGASGWTILLAIIAGAVLIGSAVAVLRLRRDR
jgi:hypothetical protein